ncbi:MAG: iron-containing alcohol dehydrogenase [Anaerorhabdus sp.]
MKNFIYHNPSKLIFTKDIQTDLANELSTYQVKNLLLVYSGDYINDLGIMAVIEDICSKQHINLFKCSKVVANPKIELVKEMSELGKKEGVDFILAVGGGSAIDSAKAIALSIPYPKDPWDFFCTSITPSTAIPVGVISTLPSSGSETSNAAIISKGLEKKGVETQLIIPKFAIANPEYTLTLPSYQSFCGIADILSHLLERYFTNIKNVDTTDYLIEGAIKSLLLNAERIKLNPSDINARAEIQILSTIAHNNSLDMGRESCWGAHRIEHELSAQYNVTHGEGMAIVFIAWCKYVAEKNPFKLAQLACRVFNYDPLTHSHEELAFLLAKELKHFFSGLDLKVSLSQLNIDKKHFNIMANRATNNNKNPIGHYIKLYNEDIIDILTLAL